MRRETEFLERPRAEPDFAMHDDMADWAISHPLINPQAEVLEITDCNVRCTTSVRQTTLRAAELEHALKKAAR
jgi:hypothetical protein